jgi:peptidoglycan/LPS O-acetylase OafA/YrhL
MLTNSNGDAGKQDATGRPYLQTIAANYEHVPSLDGLRAISIAAVLFTHFIAPRGPGGYGVFLFFIISGFLITRLLFAEQKIRAVNIKDFYLRRFFRLYPVLLVFTLIAICISYIRYRHLSLDEAFAALFYYSNFLIVHKELTGAPWRFEAFQVFWSLSIEEHFYLFFPVIFFFLRRADRIIILSISVIVICTAARYGMASAYPELIGTHYFGMLTQYRIDSIALGVLLAAMCEVPAGQRLVMLADRYWVLAIAFAVLAAGFILLRDPALKTALRWPMLGFPLLVMIAAVVFSPRHRLAITMLNHPFAVWTGKLSYSLYVWHMLAGYAAHSIFSNAIIGTICAIFFAYLFAAASYYFIEQPMIRAGKRIRKPAPRASSDTPAQAPST